jgi:hypothetical protein
VILGQEQMLDERSVSSRAAGAEIRRVVTEDVGVLGEFVERVQLEPLGEQIAQAVLARAAR